MSGSMSSTMSLKVEPNLDLKRQLRRYGRSGDFDLICSLWTMEPNSPSSLMRHYVADATGADYYEIDVSDKSTWVPRVNGRGEATGDKFDVEDVIGDVPGLDYFTSVFKALKVDDKRATKRSSYEF